MGLRSGVGPAVRQTIRLGGLTLTLTLTLTLIGSASGDIRVGRPVGVGVLALVQ